MNARRLENEPSDISAARKLSFSSPEEAIQKALELAPNFYPQLYTSRDQKGRQAELNKYADYLRGGFPLRLGPYILVVNGNEVIISATNPDDTDATEQLDRLIQTNVLNDKPETIN
jgi:hypothetical protein